MIRWRWSNGPEKCSEKCSEKYSSYHAVVLLELANVGHDVGEEHGWLLARESTRAVGKMSGGTYKRLWRWTKMEGSDRPHNMFCKRFSCTFSHLMAVQLHSSRSGMQVWLWCCCRFLQWFTAPFPYSASITSWPFLPFSPFSGWWTMCTDYMVDQVVLHQSLVGLWLFWIRVSRGTGLYVSSVR